MRKEVTSNRKKNYNACVLGKEGLERQREITRKAILACLATRTLVFGVRRVAVAQ